MKLVRVGLICLVCASSFPETWAQGHDPPHNLESEVNKQGVSQAITRAKQGVDPGSNKRLGQAIEEKILSFEQRFSVPQMSAEALLKSWPIDDLVVLDVRSTAERKVSMLPDAITLQEFESRQGYYKDKKIVAYCTIGYRSSRYVTSLRRKGFDAYNLRGSILQWVYSGGQVFSNGQPVQQVHTFSEEWDLLPESWEGVTSTRD